MERKKEKEKNENKEKNKRKERRIPDQRSRGSKKWKEKYTNNIATMSDEPNLNIYIWEGKDEGWKNIYEGKDEGWKS